DRLRAAQPVAEPPGGARPAGQPAAGGAGPAGAATRTHPPQPGRPAAPGGRQTPPGRGQARPPPGSRRYGLTGCRPRARSTTVRPIHRPLAPTRSPEIAAHRCIPDVWAVLPDSSPPRITRRPVTTPLARA